MRSYENQAIIITDLGYGDAGKGSMVDYLTRGTKAHTVVRFNGGAQAAHNVITPDGRHHTFAQFGSNTFIPGTKTHISRFMYLNPLAMLTEERHLDTVGVHDGFARMSLDRNALITTPFQQSANRLREIARGENRHGSCGMGIGETMSDWLNYGQDVLFAGDLEDRNCMLKKLAFIRDAKLAQLEPELAKLQNMSLASQEVKAIQDKKNIERTADIYQHFASLVDIVSPEYLAELMNQPGTVIFEGAQGVLLDECYGFYPYSSRSTLTNKNADTLLNEIDYGGEILKLGLMRAYATRHGAGPFVTEDAILSEQVQDTHNKENAWQRVFRVGYLDFVTLRYALAVIGHIDGLVVTNLDRMQIIPEWLACNTYRYSCRSKSLPEFFDLQENLVCNIKIPVDVTDLGKHRERTEFLKKMQPVYSKILRDERAYIDLISRILGIPVIIKSSGPTANDKAATLLVGNPNGEKRVPAKMELV